MPIRSFRHRYRAALLLLLLYCFVAMPVQVWHHHHCKQTHTSAKGYNDDCWICAHQFTPHLADAHLPAFAAPETLTLLLTPPTLWLAYYAPTKQVNKGPPSL
jgi:hypothetical protein